MENVLENCNSLAQTVNGNYCTECGQKKFKRIDHTYVFDEVKSFAFYTEKGFFYSVKNIILNPGKTARKFLEGRQNTPLQAFRSYHGTQWDFDIIIQLP